jgi:hypothetical protein
MFLDSQQQQIAQAIQSDKLNLPYKETQIKMFTGLESLKTYLNALPVGKWCAYLSGYFRSTNALTLLTLSYAGVAMLPIDIQNAGQIYWLNGICITLAPAIVYPAGIVDLNGAIEATIIIFK